MKAEAKWFENLAGAAGNALRLFYFPYAGGGAHVFRTWQRYFSPEISLTLAHLPGRGARIGEPPFRNINLLVNALADALIANDPPPFAFWGHSMGALLSFELARELRRRGRTGPLALFVSGRSAPQVPDSDPPTFKLPDEEFIAELRRLQGTPEEVLTSRELKDLFLPVIRADFELVETYTYQQEPALDCPIQVYGGLQDVTVPASSLREWQEQTSQACRVRMFPGGHFFIHTAAMDVVQTLRRDVLDFTVQGSAGHRTD